jgi:hypothetical protein
LALLKLIAPGLVVAVLAVLIFSLVFYALLPYRRRAYVPILVMTAAGFALGQLWDFLGLPALRLGQANMIPAIAFALLLAARPFRATPEAGAERTQRPKRLKRLKATGATHLT